MSILKRKYHKIRCIGDYVDAHKFKYIHTYIPTYTDIPVRSMVRLKRLIKGGGGRKKEKKKGGDGKEKSPGSNYYPPI